MAAIIGFFTPFPWWVKVICVVVFGFINNFIPILPEILALGIFVYCFIQVLKMPWWAMLIFFALVIFYIVWCIIMYKELNKQAQDV